MLKRLLFSFALISLVSFATAQLQTGSPWPKAHGNLQNTNEGLGTGITTPYLEWTWGRSSDQCSAAVISANGTLFFGDSNGGNNYLVAVNSLTGALKWEYSVVGQIKGSPAIGKDGTVYVGTNAGRIYALTDNSTSATEKWTIPGTSPIEGSLAIDVYGTVIFGNNYGTLFGLIDSGTQGTIKFGFAAGSPITTCPVIGTDTTIYFGADDEKFYALDSFGNLNDTYLTGSSSGITQDSSILPIGDIIGLAGEFEYTLTSSLAFNSGDAFGTSAGTPAVPGNNCFFPLAGASSSNDLLITWPSNTWSYQSGAKTSTPTVVQATDGTLYFASDQLYSLTNTGTLNWNYPISPQASMAMDAGGTLYMPDSVNGGFAAIGNPITSFTLPSSSVYAGNSVTTTIQFAKSLTSEDIATTEVGSNSAQVNFVSLTQVSGQTYHALFSTNQVSSPQTVTLTATYSGFSVATTLTLKPLSMTQVKVAPTSVQGGQAAKFAVYLNGTAGPSGTAVQLISSSTDASLPTTLTVPSGATAANVTVHTVAVSAQEAITLTATFGASSLHTTLTLTPAALTGIKVAPTAVQGGNNSALAVYLNGIAGPSGAVASLSSNSSAASIPTTITVPQGATDANVVVHTSSVSSSTLVTFTATLGSATLHATLTVNPAVLSSVKLAQSSVIGGNPTTLGVYLTGLAGPGGTTVNLSSGSSAAAVASALLVPQGVSDADATVHTVPVSASTPVVITATLGSTSKQITLTVAPAALHAVLVQPSSVTGGTTTAFAVYLNGAAGPGGTVVTLTSSSAKATIPATITVPQGATATNVQVHTLAVTSGTQATLTATLGSVSLHTTLTINP